MATTQSNEVPFHTAIKDRLPDLIRNQNCTLSMSVSGTHYVGPFKEWTTFENEVRTNSMEYFRDYSAELDEVMMYKQPTGGLLSFGNELVVCGNEIGVSGRFAQHLGQVVSCVAQHLHIPLMFGDWRTPRSGGLDMSHEMPDVCFMDASHEPRIVGELKTPWTAFLDTILHDGAGMGGDFRRLTGQLSNYMNNARLKYGFISTYEQTIFFKEDLCANGKIGLSYSRVIYYDTASENVPTARNYPVGQVSLRECMLYFLRLASQGNEAWRSQARKPNWNRESVVDKSSKGLPENGVTFTQSPRQRGGMGGNSSRSGAGSSSSHRVRGADHGPPRDVHGAVRVMLHEGKYWHLLHHNTLEPVEDWKWKNDQFWVKIDGLGFVAVIVEDGPMKIASIESPRDVHGAVRVKLYEGKYWHLLHHNTPEPVEDWKWENGQFWVKIDGLGFVAVIVQDSPTQNLIPDMIRPRKKWRHRILAF